MADELETENYRLAEAIRRKEKDIVGKWQELLALLQRHKQHLQSCCDLMALMREVDSVADSIKELEVRAIVGRRQ